MSKLELSFPELGLIAGTRGMLGAGVGLLIASKLDPERRKGIGWTLVAVGALSTIPLVMIALAGRRRYVGRRDTQAR